MRIRTNKEMYDLLHDVNVVLRINIQRLDHIVRIEKDVLANQRELADVDEEDDHVYIGSSGGNSFIVRCLQLEVDMPGRKAS